MHPAPPLVADSSSSASRTRSWLSWLAVTFVALFVGVVFFHYNPANYSVFPKCAFHQLTGMDCPGCGGQRALHQLLHGNLTEAFRENPLVICLMPLGIFLFGRWVLRQVTGCETRPVFRHHLWGWVLAALIVVFWIVRNLPFAPFTWLAS